jgi:hypothetical protein
LEFRVFRVQLGLALAVLVVLGGACLASPEPGGNRPPEVSSLESQYTNVYPLGFSGIKCVASDPDGDVVQFRWSCTGGSFTGNGPVVTWGAPNDYGEYHIMVVAKDGNGGSAQATLTINVVPRPYRGCCGR